MIFATTFTTFVIAGCCHCCRCFQSTSRSSWRTAASILWSPCDGSCGHSGARRSSADRYLCSGYFSASHYQQPYAAFRAELEKLEGIDPALIVTTDWLVAGNAKLQWPDVPVMTTQFPDLEPAGIGSHTRPVVLLWRGKATEPPKGLLNWAKSRLGGTLDLGPVKNLTLPYDGR